MSQPNLIAKILNMRYRFYYQWRKMWCRFNGPRGFGRFAAHLAGWGLAPYHGRLSLAAMYPQGYIRPSAYANHPNIRRGKNVYIGDNVTLLLIYAGSGQIVLGDRVYLIGDTMMHSGSGASIFIGEETHIQPGVRLHAFVGDIRIGKQVEIAAGCAIYSYNHGMASDRPIMEQELTSKGPVTIGDGAWLGHGVTVLSGVHIGRGAVIAAGAVVNKDIPDNAIAGGVPAKVIGTRPISDAGLEHAPAGSLTR